MTLNETDSFFYWTKFFCRDIYIEIETIMITLIVGNANFDNNSEISFFVNTSAT